MKKACLLIFIVAVTFAVLVLSSCEDIPENQIHGFSLETYIRNEQYNASFTYHSTKMSKGIFAYAEHLDMIGQEAEELLSLVETDILLFQNGLQGLELQEPSVYVVLRTVRTGAYWAGSILYARGYP